MALTARQEALAREFAACNHHEKAALAAGYAPKTARHFAWRMLAKPEVAAMVQSLRLEIAQKAQVEAAEMLEFWAKVVRDETEQMKHRLDASEKIGKHLGMFIDRQIHEFLDRPKAWDQEVPAVVLVAEGRAGIGRATGRSSVN